MISATLFDGHVHVHKTTDVPAMLTAAARNFAAAGVRLKAEQWTGVLLLSEMAHRQWFEEIAARQEAAGLGSWQLGPVPDQAVSLTAVSRDGAQVTIVAGGQVITSERIEVLALATRTRIADGAPLEKTIALAQEAGALVVLPWGAGKWLGPRGRLVERALSMDRASPVFAGDNRGRPWCLGHPEAFAIAQRKGLPVLAGTDPLALPGEERNVGSCGFAIAGMKPDDLSGVRLRDALASDAPEVRAFGRHVGPLRFIRNQIALRVRGVRYP